MSVRCNRKKSSAIMLHIKYKTARILVFLYNNSFNIDYIMCAIASKNNCSNKLIKRQTGITFSIKYFIQRS